MSNKNLNIQQWATVGSVSTPDGGYRKFYPKTGEYFWYTVSDDGTEKQVGLSIYPKNGLLSTTLGSGNQFGTQLDVVLGSGLTFSSNAPGSAIIVIGLTSISLSSTGGATAGYLLSVLSNGTFNWIPNNPAGISGTTNSIPKFSTTTSIGDSQIKDNGSNVFIGTLPSSAVSRFNVNGSASFLGNIYLTDDSSSYIKWDNGYYFYSNTYDFSVDGRYINYIRGSQDPGLNSFSFSVLNDSFYLERTGATSGATKFKGKDLSDVTFGRIDQETTFDVIGVLSVNSASGGLLITSTAGVGFTLQDGNEGDNKLLVSGGFGSSTWKYLESGSGISVSGITISVNNGNGLTFSAGKLVVQNGNGLTFSNNNLTINNGLGLTFSGNSVLIQSGNGITFSGNSLVINNGNGLTFSNGQLTLNLGTGLTFSGNTVISNITNGVTNYYISATPSGYTGTHSETIIKTVQIPAGVVTQYNMVEIEFRIWKGGASSAWVPSLRIGTSSTNLGLGIVTPGTFFTASVNAVRVLNPRRNLLVLSATNSTEFFPNRSSWTGIISELSDGVDTSTPSYQPIDWTVNQWVQVCSKMDTAQPATDTITASAVQVKIWKQ